MALTCLSIFQHVNHTTVYKLLDYHRPAAQGWGLSQVHKQLHLLCPHFLSSLRTFLLSKADLIRVIFLGKSKNFRKMAEQIHIVTWMWQKSWWSTFNQPQLIRVFPFDLLSFLGLLSELSLHRTKLKDLWLSYKTTHI